MLDRLFLAHPRSVGESYLEHQRMAFGFAMTLLGASLACLVHGLVPAFFETTGSRTVLSLHGRMIANRRAPHSGTATRRRAFDLQSPSP